MTPESIASVRNLRPSQGAAPNNRFYELPTSDRFRGKGGRISATE